MITRRTKVQLLVFVLITVIGVTFVGGRYAKLDRLFYDTTYNVAAQFEGPGGIFTQAGVTYRGVTVGRVGELRATEDGVAVILEIDKDAPPIPADTRAIVANKSAVGEQYVDLQPETDEGPFLEDGSEIPQSMTAIPISTTTLLTNLSEMVRSVDNRDLSTVLNELGDAFDGTGQSLAQIIDTGNAFIREADNKFEVTTALIRDSNTVLGTQIDSASAIRSFTRDLALFSDTLVASDADLRTVIESGQATSRELRTFLEQNGVDLGELINNLVTTGEITRARIPGLRQLLLLYPYVIAGGYTVVGKDPDTGLYNAHFGMILTTEPHVCKEGYDTKIRTPQDLRDIPMNESARCEEPQAKSNARGAQHSPGAGANRAPVVAAYDGTTGELQFTDKDPSGTVTYNGGARAAFGDDSWKWLLLGPLSSTRE
ncbi:MAG: MlaD family protein [Nocardioides sp.]|nr:MlaD family protein [Nocardioides sp.]